MFPTALLVAPESKIKRAMDHAVSRGPWARLRPALLGESRLRGASAIPGLILTLWDVANRLEIILMSYAVSTSKITTPSITKKLSEV